MGRGESDADHQREIERRNAETLRKLREQQRRREEEHRKSIERNYPRR